MTDRSPSPRWPSAILPSAMRDASDPLARAFSRFRAAIGAATLLMLGLSWPLWVGTDDFPRVPFVGGLPDVSAPASWVLYGLLMVAVATAAAGLAWRPMLGLAAVLLVGSILLDQHRF